MLIAIVFCSKSCTSIPCGWNQSTKKVIELKKISEIVVRKKIRTKLGGNSKTEINREENRMIELNKFDPKITEYQNITEDRLSNLLFSLSKSNSDAVLFKSIEGCAIPAKSNLTVLGIANSVSLENLNDDEKIAKFLRCICFSDNDVQGVQAIAKMTRISQNLLTGRNIEREALQLQNIMMYLPKLKVLIPLKLHLW